MPLKVILPTENYLGSVKPSWSRWFLIGAMELQKQGKLKVELSDSLDMANAEVKMVPRGRQITLMEVRKGRKTKLVWLDWTDWPHDRYPEAPTSDFYFSVWCPENSNMLPMGLCAANRNANGKVYGSGPPFDTSNQFVNILPSLRHRRTTAVDTDSFEYDVLFCGRSGDVEDDYRGPVIKALYEAQMERGWKVFLRVKPYRGKRHPLIPADVSDMTLNPYDYFNLQARTKVSVCMQGKMSKVVHGDWTWRHVESAGIGSSIVSAPFTSLLPGKECPFLFAHSGKPEEFLDCIQECIDLSREERMQNMKDTWAYYDNYLSPVGAATHVLNTVMGE